MIQNYPPTDFSREILSGVPRVEINNDEQLGNEVLQTTPVFLLFVGTDERIRYINRTRPGYALDKVVGSSIFSYLPEEEHVDCRIAMDHIRKTGQPYDYEVSAYDADGKLIRYRCRTAPVWKGNEFVGYSIAAVDMRKPQAGDVGSSVSNGSLPPLEHLGIRIDFVRYKAYYGNCELGLTPTEFRLLTMFVRQPGKVFSRKELLQAVVGDSVRSRTIDVHIRSLRKKLKKGRYLVQTVHGVGYRLRESE
ncbi:MAG: hypothetical protein KatS3mg105_4075 [Gemmatales bacterium]|nr:MAG: hypothetical protein KatS3mg105_4075 [Gemmatales bacterium]